MIVTIKIQLYVTYIHRSTIQERAPLKIFIFLLPCYTKSSLVLSLSLSLSLHSTRGTHTHNNKLTCLLSSRLSIPTTKSQVVLNIYSQSTTTERPLLSCHHHRPEIPAADYDLAHRAKVGRWAEREFVQLLQCIIYPVIC